MMMRRWVAGAAGVILVLATAVSAGTEKTMDLATLERMVLEKSSEAYLVARHLGLPAQPLLLRLLEHRDAGVRDVALICFNENASAADAPVFVRALTDSGAEVRRDALRYLRTKHSPEVLPELLRLMIESPHEIVRREVPLIIGRIGEPAAITPLRERLPQEANPETAGNIRRALARLGDAEPRAALLAQLADPDPAVRYQGLRDFEYIADQREGARLRPLLADRAVAIVMILGNLRYAGRICDLTVNLLERMFAARFSFETADRMNYADAELAEAERFLDGAVGEPKTPR